jgi:protein O-mannosyl-transferase
MNQQKSKGLAPNGIALPVLEENFSLFPWLNRKMAAIVIALVAIIFYSTSVNSEYALDDGIIIHQNDHVLKGVRGIGGILGRDAYESFYRRMCATDQLAGGRYRPLSVVSFALEQELLGTYRTGLYMKTEDSNRNGILDKNQVSFVTPCGRTETNFEYNSSVDANADGIVQGNECPACWDRNNNLRNDREEDVNSDGLYNEVDCQLYGASFRHFNNIWLFALGCVLLYVVFSTCFFRTKQDLAFLAALLFTAHPIHSEAVANVKSRDEIFSLIFISWTFIYTFRYLETRRLRTLFTGCAMFLLALLSKEYAAVLIILLPVSVYCFTLHGFTIGS